MRTPKQQEKYERAKKKVNDEKGFYGHLTAYIIVNIFILIVNLTSSNFELNDWFFLNVLGTPILWGIGLFFHWMKVFGRNPFFSKDWEERKIRKILEEEEDFFKNN